MMSAQDTNDRLKVRYGVTDRMRRLGLDVDGSNARNGELQTAQLVQYINVKLAALGLKTVGSPDEVEFIGVASDLLAHYRQTSRLLDNYLCPADQRIQDFLDHHLASLTLNGKVRLPGATFVSDRHGLARELSLPCGKNYVRTDLLESYRVRQGVLHNPKSDRRTTEGVFHVAEGGLPIPADKKSVPLLVFGNLLHAALNPPASFLKLPFTAQIESPAEVFVSLLLRPVVVPDSPGFSPRKTMEIRYFAPGALVANLDFVESIFGNAGNPFLPENDAAIDVQHWTGHTGCIILAPHLTGCVKKELGLPHFDQASPRQREQGMCWRDPSEKYNDGKPFKITCRTEQGIMVTILADNYFGYSKKEVKTQISFAANLYGSVEEEHAGGALTFPCYLQGERFLPNSKLESKGQTFADTVAALGDTITVMPEGYAVDKTYPSIVYVPEDVSIDTATLQVTWIKEGQTQTIKLLAQNVYVLPTGYKVRYARHPGASFWQLVGTAAEGTFLHKPCTVSGGGKSEISKSILGSIRFGPIFTADLNADLDQVEAITRRDYSDRFLPNPNAPEPRPSRPLLSPKRSLGSVIKLLTPSPEYTPAYNAWLESIPNHIRPLVFIIKRRYQPEWGDNWRQHFTVDQINGAPGHELKVGNRQLVGSYLRVGFAEDGGWRMHKVRQDFIAADKVQMEDDISASAVVPTDRLPELPDGYDRYPSVKIVENCEWRLFQRPDDAIHPGRDVQAENDMAQPGLFASNYAPVSTAQAREIVEDVAAFGQFSPPMSALLLGATSAADDAYVVSSAHPRIVDGKPTKNPRYLQTRPDVAVPRDRHLAEVSTRLFRRLKPGDPVVFPVSSILAGRRNNPPEAGIRALAVFNPIHFQELPELFMDYICSLTGKSPSTTGAGSEGALTKGPFNALLPAPDLNNALVGYVLTGYAGYTTAAGCVGPRVRVDHDISLLIPELWARLPVHQRDPKYLIANGYLEKVNDFTHNGRRVLASRLGYRITEKFVHDFFGKVFDNPSRVFDAPMLRPELQDIEAFVDGIDNIVEAQQRVAKFYFLDGSFEACCPPLQGLLKIMAAGAEVDPAAIEAASLRNTFSREHLLSTDWYAERLRVKQTRDIALWTRHVAALERFIGRASHADIAAQMKLDDRLAKARAELRRVGAVDYIDSLRGTLGADPLGGPSSTVR
jgi:phosphoenolpyruvate carboxykinase (diphosphate)